VYIYEHFPQEKIWATLGIRCQRASDVAEKLTDRDFLLVNVNPYNSDALCFLVICTR